MTSRARIIIGSLFFLFAGFAGGFYYRGARAVLMTSHTAYQMINADSGRPADLDFSIFWNVWNVLHERYVDRAKLDDRELLHGAINGMISVLKDSYTAFFTPEENELFSQEIEGEFFGIGIEIGTRNNQLTVIAPLEDSPAMKAGLRAKDRIAAIDEKNTDDMFVGEAVGLIRGKRHTLVVLTIEREGEGESRNIPIIRDVIRIPAVKLFLIPAALPGNGQKGVIAHIKALTFNRNFDSEFEDAVDKALKDDSIGIVLDLRNNPGGLLDSAVHTASYFIKAGETVVIERFGDGTENIFRAKPNGKLRTIPIVVIVNEGSASASEIVAGALRDNNGTKIVGMATFGKGSVQQLEELNDDYSLKVTTARWFTPKGTSIEGNGIEPDVVLERTEEDIQLERDPQLDRAIELLISIL